MRTILFITAFMLSASILFAGGIKELVLQKNQQTQTVLVDKGSGFFSAKTSVARISAADVSTPQGDFIDLVVEGFTKNYASPGKPHLPVKVSMIEIPQDAEWQVIITSYNETIIELNDEGLIRKIAPAQPSYSKGLDPSQAVYLYDAASYQLDDFNTDEMVRVVESGELRGVRLGKVIISPFRYNPVQNTLKVYTDIEFKVVFNHPNVALTNQLKTEQYSPVFESTFNMLLNYTAPASKDAITVWPITYLIVSDRMFETTLQSFTQWKTKKGFKIVIGYTDVIGTTTTAIKTWIQNQYNTLSPKPTYVLFVGDVTQIPTYSGTGGSGGHPADVYYSCFGGSSDFIPEMYSGRFSAESTTELTTIINKTLMHEQYTWPSETFLDKSVMVAGVDASFAPTHGNGQIYYGIDQYFNTTNGYSNIYAYIYGTSSHPYQVMSSGSSGASADIRAKISGGVGFANYTAHCSEDGWADPSFTRTNISALTNNNMYPVMIGNCCLSNKFNTSDCFGEMIVYTANKGAVAYLGASNNSLWDEDFYWSVGINTLAITSANAQSHTYANTQRGAYDGVWHTHSEPYADWYMTTGAMNYIGNMSVENSSSSNNKYYWEIYHIMGDPSLMAYLSIPTTMTVTHTNPIPVGTTSLVVNTEQYAYVAISQNGVLLDAEYSMGNTSVTLTFPAFTAAGTADIVVTKQNRKPYIGTVTISAASNQYDAAMNVITRPTGTIHTSLATMQPQVTIRNAGTTTMTSCKVRYKIDNGSTVNFDWTGSLATNATAVVNFPSITLPSGAHTFTAWTALPNNQTDQYTANDTLITNFTVYSGEAELVSINEPTALYCGASSVAPSFTIRNNDTYALTSVTVGYTLDGGAPVTQAWTGNLTSGQTAVVTFPTISPSVGNHTIVASVSNPNGGADADPSNDSETLAFDMSNGQPLPFTEGFENTTFPPTGWVLVNPDAGVTWTRTASSGNGASTASAYMNFYDYNTTGQNDELNTPIIDLSSAGAAIMTFNVAYRQYQTENDRLRIFISTDCGTTFNASPLYDKQGSTLATTTASTSEFTPTLAAHWRNDTVDLSAYAGQSIMIKFMATNAYGNNLFIDDINIESNDMPPTANFSADVLSTCTGLVQFTNLTTLGSTYLWNFGDGTTSTDENPAHTYTANGVFTVTLTATNIYGQDVETKTSYITVSMPTAPTVTNATICGPGAITLTAAGSGILEWYDAATGGTLVNTGTTYAIANLTATTTYYVEDHIVQASQTVPSPSSSTGGGTNTSASYLIFDAVAPFQLVSVEMNNTGTTGDKTIQLLNSTGGVIDQVTVSVPNGVSRVTLDISVPVGTNMRLAGPANSSLYRVNTGVAYPYQIPGLVNITGSSGGATYYYYFYQWEVRALPDCISSRAPVTGTVESATPVSVSISATNTSICSGTSVTFTATPTNGGTTPSYQWKRNGTNVGTNSPTWTSSTLTNGANVTCVLTSSSTCATSNPATSNTITMTVTPSVTASVNISASSTSICAGTSVTFTATPANGGSTPVYLWSLNGNTVGSNSPTYTSASLADGDVIFCKMTSNANCVSGSPANSNTITMNVDPAANPSVSISASTTSVCIGENVIFTATPTDGGTAPVYTWKVNGGTVGSNSPTYSSLSLANGDIVSCTMVSNAPCASSSPVSSNTVTMTVASSLPVAVGISAPVTSVCQGESITFTAIPQNQGAIPVYQWQVNGINVGTNSATYTATNLNNNDNVQCILSSSLSCATGNPASSNTIQVTVSTSVTAGLSVDVTDNQICTGETVTFTATPTNGGSTPAYQWYINGNPLVGYTTETVTSSSVPNGANIWCEMTSSAACVSGSPALSNTIIMAVSDVPVAGFTYVPNQLEISFTNTSTGGTSYLWDFGDTETSPDLNPVHTYAVDGMYIVTLTVYNSCDTVNVMQSVNAYGTGFSNLISGVNVAVYPNPNKGEFYVSVNSGEVIQLNIEVSDLVGRNVFATETTETSGKNLYSIDLGENENGVYLVKVTIGDNTSIYRIMVQ